MKEKTLDLENGFELVIEGDFKEQFKYSQGIVEVWGSDGHSRLYVREKKDDVKDKLKELIRVK